MSSEMVIKWKDMELRGVAASLLDGLSPLMMNPFTPRIEVKVPFLVPTLKLLYNLFLQGRLRINELNGHLNQLIYPFMFVFGVDSSINFRSIM